MDCNCGNKIIYKKLMLCRSCYNKQWRESNKDHLRSIKQNWSNENKLKKSEIEKQWRLRNKDNKQVFLRKNIRNRLADAILDISSHRTIDLLGCSIEELKVYLESKFQQGMTWDNYGIKGWHIDHIKPLSNFDLTRKEELIIACSYKNLQPLWAEDHIDKTSKENTMRGKNGSTI